MLAKASREAILPLLSTSLILLSLDAEAREILLPPGAPIQPAEQQQRLYEKASQHNRQYSQHTYHEDRTYWSETLYAGLATWGNLPWTPCLASLNTTSQTSRPPQSQDSQEKVPYVPTVQPYDIAILGAPFDTATTGRPGTRFGPTGIRQGSRRIAPHSSWSVFTNQNHLLDWASIVDCGNAPLTFLDNTAALTQLQESHELISSRLAATKEVVIPVTSGDDDNQIDSSTTKTTTIKTSVPRTIVLGGDHLTTLAALRAAHTHWGPVSVIHFDSHIDTWDPDVLGGGISHYAGVNHGTFLHIAHEEGLLLNDTNLHVGIRAPLINKRHDRKNDKRCGFDIVTARDLDKIGIDGVVAHIKNRVGTNRVYISVDIDVLDPAYAPGTGTAEVGGWTTRELLSVLDGLVGLNVMGADVVEVSPIYDNAGETTVLAASEIVLSIIGLMVEKPVSALVDL